jgi:two-component system sensor histidine kinase CpxA
MQVALGILEQRAEPAQRPYLEDVREEARQMSDLVGDLLSFSRAGLARNQVALQAVQLANFAQTVIERESSGSAEVKMHIPEDVWAMADPDLLARALANLLRNSIRYAGERGPIAIQGGRSGSDVYLEVRDHGPGVAEASLQRIFDPFYRGDVSRTRETGGVGLGLAIVKTCVEACEGSVRAQNVAPSGLLVTITLRLAERPAGEGGADLDKSGGPGVKSTPEAGLSG